MKEVARDWNRRGDWGFVLGLVLVYGVVHAVIGGCEHVVFLHSAVVLNAILGLFMTFTWPSTGGVLCRTKSCQEHIWVLSVSFILISLIKHA